MRRPDLADGGVVAAAAAVAALTSEPGDPAYVVSLLFVTAMLTLLGLVLRHAVETARGAYAEQGRARSLAELDLEAAARRAVLQERSRLSDELDASIRAALSSIRHELAGMDDGDARRERARRIHLRARETTSELRRQLGLLRINEPPLQVTAPTRSAPRVTGRTLAFAAVVAGVAALENWGYHSTGEYASPAFVPVWSLPLTAVSAATVVGWRVAPVTSAAVLAGLLVMPPLTGGVMVGSGAWMLATLGCLTWGLASRGVRDVRAVLAATALAGAVAWSRLRDDPQNLGICLLLVAATWTVGLVVGWSLRRREAAARRAAALQADIDAARDEAVQGERLALARDLHDVVSHAVGVIAIQAAAAEVSWPDRPELALRAFETIERVLDDALAELDRVVPGQTAPARPHDLTALVDRIRATGTQVRLTLDGVAAEDADPIVYRIAQEGLTNAVRHAPAAAVDVFVEALGDAVRVRVSDDGPGPAEGGPRGFGLVGLAERVSLLGGTFRSTRGPDGRGFVVEATVPAQRGDGV